jgi:hypothetical protein
MRCIAFSLFLATLLCQPALVRSQEPVPSGDLQLAATLSGTVSDPTGAVLAGVRVEARNKATGAGGGATTDSSGRFRIENLAPGIYFVTVGKEGFGGQTIDDVRVGAGQSNSLNVTFSNGPVPIGDPKIPPFRPGVQPTPDPGEKPGTEPDSGSRRVPVPDTPPAAGTGSKHKDVVAKSFATEQEARKWLNEQAKNNLRLTAIISLKNKTNLFVFKKVPSSQTVDYLTESANGDPDPATLQDLMSSHQNKVIVGVIRILPNTYVVVFRDDGH